MILQIVYIFAVRIMYYEKYGHKFHHNPERSN